MEEWRQKRSTAAKITDKDCAGCYCEVCLCGDKRAHLLLGRSAGSKVGSFMCMRENIIKGIYFGKLEYRQEQIAHDGMDLKENYKNLFSIFLYIVDEILINIGYNHL